MHRVFTLSACLLLTAGLLAPSAAAQPERTRYGFGLNLQADVREGVGMGLRTRLSQPLNADLSAALDLGLTGFIFLGLDDASYLFDPQASLIVTVPQQSERALYILTGLGLYIPIGDDEGRPASPFFHLGAGWVQRLYETTIYYEADPQMLIEEDKVRFALPLRIGIIF